MSGRRTQSRGLLVLGAALIALSQMRWGIGILAFVAPVPLLLYMRNTSGWRSRGLVMLAVWAGYTLATMKLVTEPLPWMFGFAFALPFGILNGLLYVGSDAIRRRTSELAGVIAFPAMMVVGEYVMHRFTPFGSWAAAAYTQLENLPLLQVSSLVGLAGVSFIVYLLPPAIESAVGRARSARQALIGAFSVLVAATAFGSVRLHAAGSAETVQVAAIGTDGAIGGWPLPPQEERDRVDDGLFARTAEAARQGAKLVAWNEAANAVLPHNEAAYIERLQASARDNQIELVASYIVPDNATHMYRNKYVWVRPDGSIDHVYHKHNPVPGEPAEKGTEPFKAVDTDAGRATGAICYDFDFPALGLALARLDIDLAVVPSSDWRGIDPIHTQMASVRAIEGGYSLLRSTRWGLSAGYDPYGRVRGWQSSFDSQAKILMVGLPVRGIDTFYTVIGDAFVALCAAIAAGLVVIAFRQQLRVGRRQATFTPIPQQV